MYTRVCIVVSACSDFICTCVCCCGCICMDRVYIYMRGSISVCVSQVYMYMQVIHKCIIYALITNRRCIGMDFKLVCMCISYIYIEHPIVYMHV